MLAKKHRIKKKKDFELIFKKGKIFKNTFLILRTLKNNFKLSRFAIVVSQKVSKKATERNKIRRKISSFLEKSLNSINEGVDFVFLVLPSIKEKSSVQIGEKVDQLLKNYKK